MERSTKHLKPEERTFANERISNRTADAENNTTESVLKDQPSDSLQSIGDTTLSKASIENIQQNGITSETIIENDRRNEKEAKENEVKQEIQKRLGNLKMYELINNIINAKLKEKIENEIQKKTEINLHNVKSAEINRIVKEISGESITEGTVPNQVNTTQDIIPNNSTDLNNKQTSTYDYTRDNNLSTIVEEEEEEKTYESDNDDIKEEIKNYLTRLNIQNIISSIVTAGLKDKIESKIKEEPVPIVDKKIDPTLTHAPITYARYDDTGYNVTCSGKDLVPV